MDPMEEVFKDIPKSMLSHLSKVVLQPSYTFIKIFKKDWDEHFPRREVDGKKAFHYLEGKLEPEEIIKLGQDALQFIEEWYHHRLNVFTPVGTDKYRRFKRERLMQDKAIYDEVGALKQSERLDFQRAVILLNREFRSPILDQVIFDAYIAGGCDEAGRNSSRIIKKPSRPVTWASLHETDMNPGLIDQTLIPRSGSHSMLPAQYTFAPGAFKEQAKSVQAVPQGTHGLPGYNFSTTSGEITKVEYHQFTNGITIRTIGGGEVAFCVEVSKDKWLCTACAKEYKSQPICARHVKEHTNGKVECPFVATGRCGKATLFSRYDKIREHAEVHHPEVSLDDPIMAAVYTLLRRGERSKPGSLKQNRASSMSTYKPDMSALVDDDSMDLDMVDYYESEGEDNEHFDNEDDNNA